MSQVACNAQLFPPLQLFSGPELSHEVKSLQPNCEYSFRVQAANSSGLSPHSLHSSVRTLPASPAAITQVSVTSTADSITVSWTQPDDSGSQVNL